jgi:hypothetical protein
VSQQSPRRRETCASRPPGDEAIRVADDAVLVNTRTEEGGERLKRAARSGEKHARPRHCLFTGVVYVLKQQA